MENRLFPFYRRFRNRYRVPFYKDLPRGKRQCTLLHSVSRRRFIVRFAVSIDRVLAFHILIR